MTAPHPSGHPAGTGRPTVRPLTDVDRVIPGAQLRLTRDAITDHADQLRTFDCTGRVLAVVGWLVGDAAGGIVPDVLAAALREVDTVDLALDLLTDAGLGCGA